MGLVAPGTWDLRSPTGDQTCILCIARQILYHFNTREVHAHLSTRLFAFLLLICKLFIFSGYEFFISYNYYKYLLSFCDLFYSFNSIF